VPSSRFNGFGASASNPNFSTRHSDRGNAAFVDAPVVSFAIGEMQRKHGEIARSADWIGKHLLYLQRGQ
jgi:prepilin-type processing-associated H-X9-DG protein